MVKYNEYTSLPFSQTSFSSSVSDLIWWLHWTRGSPPLPLNQSCLKFTSPSPFPPPLPLLCAFSIGHNRSSHILSFVPIIQNWWCPLITVLLPQPSRFSCCHGITPNTYLSPWIRSHPSCYLECSPGTLNSLFPSMFNSNVTNFEKPNGLHASLSGSFTPTLQYSLDTL